MTAPTRVVEPAQQIREMTTGMYMALERRVRIRQPDVRTGREFPGQPRVRSQGVIALRALPSVPL